MNDREKAIIWLSSFMQNNESMTLIPKQLIRLMYDVLTQKPITNADRIRAMSDDELSEFLAECDASRIRIRSDAEAVMEEKYRWLDWLKQNG